jgi:hypothetical protein
MAKKNDNSGDRLVSDISKLAPQQYWEVPTFSKGELVRGYGTQEMSQPTDGQRADMAFERLGQPPPEQVSHASPVTPRAMSDGEMADLAWKHLGK